MTLAAPPHTSSHSSPHASPGSVPAATTLERNLSCLGERQADLARRLREMQAANIAFEQAADGLFTAQHQGRWLASRHRPRAEAERIAASVDIVEHALFVVGGFGVGHHVAELARRIDRTGVIIVYEPDLGLLRAVLERIDHSDWLRGALIVFLTDPTDRAALPRRLAGAESIVAQGVAFLEHPADRARLQSDLPAVADLVREFVAATKTTLLTTLVRAADTTRNLLGNLDHYALGPGIAPLRDAAKDRPAVVVSAGPSLQRNLDELARPGVRDRCVIVAVQTVLKPLLQAGVRPHFVTALDYHEISRRFYEGLTPSDVQDVTLVADPKAHPAILDAFPGRVRCMANGFLDRVLGPLARDMGALPAGATVAHLSFYLARHLGCNPIALVGQDLGFSDGLYYARGTAIDDVWAPELNPFNTMEMMEWSRIARHRLHLQRLTDHEGKTILSDAQMVAYLQQFERDFAEARERGVRVIDASEGGVRKQHAESMRLAELLAAHAATPLPHLPPVSEDERRPANAVSERLAAVRCDVARIASVSGETESILREILEHQRDASRISRLFKRLDERRHEVERIFEAFELVNHVNQMAVFRRMKRDRRIHLSRGADDLTKQRLQLERDLDNVVWTRDAASELAAMLDDAIETVAGDARPGAARRRHVTPPRPASEHAASVELAGSDVRTPSHVAAMIAIDPSRRGGEASAPCAATLHGRTLLQRTLERISRSRRLDSIILLAPIGFDVESLLDRSRVTRPLLIERCEQPPFGPEREAIAAARRWSRTCWRGGISGMSAWDESIAPQAMHHVMAQRGVTAAVIVAPVWPLVAVDGEGGIDSLVERHLRHPSQHNLVFSQHPPGFGACLVSASLMRELVLRNRLATIGALLVYQPRAPQGDPIARDANVQIDHRVRGALGHGLVQTPADRAMAERLPESLLERGTSVEIVEALERASADVGPALEHVILEITTARDDAGHYATLRGGSGAIHHMSLDEARRVIDQVAARGATALTLDGRGDPLLHPRFAEIIEHARSVGVAGVHVRTTLRMDASAIDLLPAPPIEVVSVDLHADRAATYRVMMGDDGFRRTLENVERLLQRRRRLTDHPGSAAFSLPWVVPRLLRCRATYEDIESFFDRWVNALGCAVIEGAPAALRHEGERTDSLPLAWESSSLASAAPPAKVVRRELLRRMMIRVDGAAPISEVNAWSSPVAGNVFEQPLHDVWRELVEQRTAWIDAPARRIVPLGIDRP